MTTLTIKLEGCETAHDTNFNRCTFLELPPELRLHICDLLYANLTDSPTFIEIKHATALLHTNRKLFNEAGDLFLRYEDSFMQMLARHFTSQLSSILDPKSASTGADLADLKQRIGIERMRFRNMACSIRAFRLVGEFKD